MLSTLRKRVKVVMIIVAAAFIAGFLMSEVWNLVRHHERPGTKNIPPGVVGQVGDYKITTDEYRQVRQYIAGKYHQDSSFRDLTNEDESRIEHLTWNHLETELTWAKVFKQTRLDITEGELEWIISNYPPPQLQNHPDLQTDGRFDTNKYRQALANPNNRQFFARYAREIYEQLRPQKLQLYVAGAIILPRNEVEQAVAQSNTVVSVTALYIGPTALKEEERNYEPSTAELRRFYAEHRRDFQPKEEIRELKFVFFPFTITPEDTAAARARIDEAYRRLVAASPASLRDSFEMAGLMFGDYEPDTVAVAFTRSQFNPAVESIVRRLKPGSFTRPLSTGNGWQIILLDSARNDTFWVKRIRTRIKPDESRELALQDQIRTFMEQAAGGDFDSVAVRMNLMLGPSPARVLGRRKLSWSVEIYNPGELVAWAADAKPGEVMPVPMRGPYGYYVFKLARIVPVKPAPFEQVQEALKWRLRQEREKKLCAEIATAALASIRSGKTLEQYAAENQQVELIHEVINGSADMMARGRRGAEFVGAALALEPGQITGPIMTNWGYYIVRCDEKRTNETPVLKPENYVQQKQQLLFQELWEKITEQPETKDWRLVRSY
ncbi:MAG: peptidyl-prolyl cis-trans isomerase [candidate division WOR-3 bacterium]|jgi:parvulin-like peptidyl-prolyl isomerase